MNDVISLSGGWELALAPTGPWQPTAVPGNWYLDGIDGVDIVWYRCRFEVTAESGPHHRLRFGAADYEAEVSVDGVIVGAHTGGFAPFWFDLVLDAGGHEVVVAVSCPTDEYETVWPHSKTTLRGVMGHHDARPGGWTARGQERSSGGLWGQVTLSAHQHAVIDSVGLIATLNGADATIDSTVVVHLFDDRPKWASVRLSFLDGDEDAFELWSETWLQPGRNQVRVRGTLAAPRLWWTWDHGEPFRYRLHTTVEFGDGDVVALDQRWVGIRSIEVAGDWVWRLNGRPMFIRGINYIGEQWLSAMTPDRAAADVALAVDANLNAMRVHAHVAAPCFYDACDAAGVLVWQDLPMQWGYEDSAEIYRVARQMVRELIDLHGWRPSVAYWAAHNESPWNEPWMMDEAGRFRPDQNQRLDHELADLLRLLDPSRPAIANSGAGDGHTYPGWYWGKWTDVSELPGGAFVSEYGAQAVPDLTTLRTYLGEDATIGDWAFHGFQHHEIHTNVGVNVLADPVERIIERTQHYQARLLQFATEVYRRKKGERVQGLMPFMLVDPWPCISWSVVDHLRRPKLGYAALTRAMQPVLPSIEASGDRYGPDEPPVFGIWWINDLARSFRSAVLSWQLVDTAGSTLGSAQQTVHVTADAARRVMQAGPFMIAPGSYAIEAQLHSADGRQLGSNRWDFIVLDHPVSHDQTDPQVP
jgi:beta-mannosidase